ncbi:MAG: TlpA family protein disulfide reductase [Bacteroidales bacterium]|nr:TlpA family protein disulfide reductase [Bacteroidales bacterium]MCF8399224.1 TlpA family protein disulfide reductase [Bacteroidales bacterium]
MRSTLLITFLLLISTVFAEKTTVQGFVSNAKNKKIKIVGYTDMISFMEVDLAESMIDKKGNFRMELDLEEPLFTQLRIEYQSSEFYIEPRSEYDLRVFYNDSTSQISFTNPVELKFDISASTGKLNQDVHAFNKMYNDFIVNNFDFLYKFRDKKLLEHFKQQVSKEFPDVRNPYFRKYIDYTIASIEKFSRIKSFNGIARDYFIEKPVLYQNIAYMDFFNQFFEKYLLSASRDVDWDEFIFYINSKPDYYMLVKTASQDALLKNDLRILEMVVLKTLKELYHLQGMNQNGINSILKTASEKMRYEENRNIASNLLKKLKLLKSGSIAEDFSLPSFDGNNYSLEDFRDTLVYLNFWNQSCKLCLQELDSIAAIKKAYKPDMQFISILTGQDSAGISTFINQKGFDWIFLYYDENYDVLEDYDVRTLPTNMLIGKYRRILKNPAWLPGESLENIIRKLMRRRVKSY